MDARGIKGAWEGSSTTSTTRRPRRSHRLADAGAVVRGSACPWDPRLPQADVVRRHRARHRRRRRDRRLRARSRRSASTCRTISGSASGTAASRCRSSNVIEAYEQVARSTASAASSAGTTTRSSAREKWGAFASELTTDIHEVLGHGSGRVAEHLNGQPQELLKEQYSAIEESRADLVALYFIADPKLAELGLVPAEDQAEIVRAEYEAYARNALVQLRRVREGHADRRRPHAQPPDDRPLAAGATRPRSRSARRDGKTYYVIVGRGGVSRRRRRGCWPKCSASSRKATTRRRARSFETYGVHFDPALRDEVVARVDRAAICPSYTGFVMPRLDGGYDAAGAITDVAFPIPAI